jgi:L-threonylcarbamoyladenylate synthase
VLSQLGDQVALIVDGGQCQVGIESTVVDLSESPPRLLRPGMIHRQALVAAIGEVSGVSHSRPGLLKSPGLLEKHYAPRAKLTLCSWTSDHELRAHIERTGFAGSKTQVIAHSHIPCSQGLGGVSVIPHDCEAFGRAIYAQLHECDRTGAQLIVVEALPETDEWRGISDRLNRAATI